MARRRETYRNLEDKHNRFTSLLLRNQRRVFGFILTIIPDRTAAEDVLQEVATVLWAKFDQYEPGTDFGAWALRIARLSTLEEYRRRAKLPLQFSEDTFAKLIDAAEAMDRDSEDLHASLRRCIETLTDRQRELLTQRYDEGLNPRQIAGRTRRAPQTIYRALQSIHRRLFECIQRRLSEDSP